LKIKWSIPLRQKSRILLMSLVGFILSVNCGGSKIPNQWVDREISIDGKFADWEGIAEHNIKEQHIVAALANDETDLYLMFRGDDEKFERQIRMMGITIWLTKEDNKQKDYGICYTGSTDIHISRRSEKASFDRRANEMSLKMGKTQGKQRSNLPGPGRIFIIQGDEKIERAEFAFAGPAAGSAYKKGVFCYEFKVPLPNQIAPNNEIKLGLELGGMSEADREYMRQEIEGMQDDGAMPDDIERPEGDLGDIPENMRGGPGLMGGRHGGMRPGKPPVDFPGFEKKEVWLTVVLANKNHSEKYPGEGQKE